MFVEMMIHAEKVSNFLVL